MFIHVGHEHPWTVLTLNAGSGSVPNFQSWIRIQIGIEIRTDPKYWFYGKASEQAGQFVFSPPQICFYNHRPEEDSDTDMYTETYREPVLWIQINPNPNTNSNQTGYNRFAEAKCKLK